MLYALRSTSKFRQSTKYNGCFLGYGQQLRSRCRVSTSDGIPTSINTSMLREVFNIFVIRPGIWFFHCRTIAGSAYLVCRYAAVDRKVFDLIKYAGLRPNNGPPMTNGWKLPNVTHLSPSSLRSPRPSFPI